MLKSKLIAAESGHFLHLLAFVLLIFVLEGGPNLEELSLMRARLSAVISL